MPHLIRFGGETQPVARPTDRPQGDKWAPLLGELSWKYVREQAEFEPYVLPPPGDTERLKEDIGAWVGRVWCHHHEMPKDEGLRNFNVLSLESEYREYIRKNGAGLFKVGMTVEEIWLSQQLHDAAPHVVFISDTFVDLASACAELRRAMPKDQIVWLLGTICLKLEIVAPTLPILVTDGDSGHTIVLSGLNSVDFQHLRGQQVRWGWFSFHDPWPARSLLAPERNYDGVMNVLEDISRPPFWLISPEELSKVIVGFLFPVDALPSILDLLSLLDFMRSTNVPSPFWAEGSPDPEVAFPIMLESHGGVTPTTSDGLVGLGRLRLMNGQPDVARRFFLGAIRIDPKEAPFKAAQWANAYGEPELAREIEEIGRRQLATAAPKAG